MKIAYCTDSICYAGGIQRVTIAKANKLALKNEVWIIVTDNKDKPVFPLSTKVHLVNCDINYFEDDWKSRFYIYKPQNKMFHFCKTFCSKITLVNTIQNVILNPI